MQVKIPETTYPVNGLIIKRWSARSFSDKPISEQSLGTILEAAAWAPSAMNEQPWRYIASLKENGKGFQALLACLNESNAVWAKNAGALILCYARLTYTRNGRENANALHDTGMANQNLLLQACSMDIYGHPMEGFNKEKARQDFKLGAEYIPVCMIALGYLASPDQLDEPYKSRELAPRSRKTLAEFVTLLKE